MAHKPCELADASAQWHPEPPPLVASPPQQNALAAGSQQLTCSGAAQQLAADWSHERSRIRRRVNTSFGDRDVGQPGVLERGG
jgi:hypothetical protein